MFLIRIEFPVKYAAKHLLSWSTSIYQCLSALASVCKKLEEAGVDSIFKKYILILIYLK